MITATVENVPQVHGYKSDSIDELMERMPDRFLGYERFWIGEIFQVFWLSGLRRVGRFEMVL